MDEVIYTDTYTEPTYTWLMEQINKPEHRTMHAQVEKIRRHFLRSHDVNARASQTYTYGTHTIVPSVVNINLLNTILQFHTSFTVGDPVSLTGDEEVVNIFNKYYSDLHRADYLICRNLVKYGNSFAYTYRDGRHIKEKVFRNEDSYPIYDRFEQMIAFVEHIDNRNLNNAEVVDTVYLPDRVDVYVNGALYSSAPNGSGLPVHYKLPSEWHYSIYADSMMADLINILDKIEEILSTTYDSVKKLSLSPILCVKGKSLTGSDAVNSIYGNSGLTLQLDYEGDASWINAECDKETISLLIQELERYFCMTAAIPSSILGSSNISNVSETSVSMLMTQTTNRAQETIIALSEGFKQRWEQMRKILSTFGETITDEQFDTLQAHFNLTKPVDILDTINALKAQLEAGALSTRSMVELSPLTADTSMEMDRLAEDTPENIE